MKYSLIIILLICHNSVNNSQDFKFLKGVNNIYVQAFITGETIQKYVEEEDLKRFVELKLIDNGIRVTDDENSKFVLTITMFSNPIDDDIAFSLNLSLAERVYLTRVKTNILADVYSQEALAGAPNNLKSKEYVNTILNDFSEDFIYKYKKDNQK